MLLQTEHVSKAFGGVYALRDVNLSLSASEIRGRWERTVQASPPSSSS